MAPNTDDKDQALARYAYRQDGLSCLRKDHTLDENGIENACPLDNGKHDINPQKSLGLLDKLPLETLCNVSVEVDIRSLTDFRRVNQRAMQIVDSIPEYDLVLKNCPGLIRGLLSTGLGSQFSCKDLSETLSGSGCENCGDYAGYTNIFTCGRVCFLCFSGLPGEEGLEYFPLTPSEAERKFGVHRGFFASLPSLKSIPGTYTWAEKIRKTRLTLLDPEAARRMSIEYHGSSQAMEQHVAELTQKSLEAYEQRVERYSGGPLPRRPASAGLKDGRVGDARRYMAIVRIPWVVKLTNTVEWGFHCGGCRGH